MEKGEEIHLNNQGDWYFQSSVKFLCVNFRGKRNDYAHVSKLS